MPRPFPFFTRAESVPRVPRRRVARARRRQFRLDVQSLEPRIALAVGDGALEPRATPLRSDTTPPVVRAVTAPAARSYGEGATIAFRVNFTEPVTVTGVPTLPITIGDTVRQAVWNGRGSGSKSLVFSTVVQAGDLAPTGVAIAGPVTFPTGAAIRDKARNDLNPAASGEFPKARVDAVGPSVSDVGQISIAGKRLSMRVTFTEPVTVRGKPSIPFTLAGAPRQLVYAGGAGSQVLVFTYRATSGETPTVETVTASTPVIALGSGRIIDGAGNVAASLAPPAETSLSAASLPENEPAGAVVGVLAAVDADGARDRHTFALVGGPGSTDNSAFEIVGNQLRTARPLDRESQATYSVRVRATDSGGLWFDEVFTLTAAEVNEAPTGVSLSNTTPTIFENASTTGRIKVADIVITDDALVTDTVTLTGTDSGSFEVDRLELFLKSGVSLDFETKQSYAVTVNVADASIPGSAPVTAGFTLTVADVNDLAPAFTSGPTGSVAENAEISTAIYTAATTDTDGSPANRAVTYSIKPGVGDASLVQIDAATGVVTLPASANFELNPSYAFTVVATNVGTGATLVSEQAVTVAVSDVNEAPTGVALTSTVSSLPENTSTASRIKVADIAITDDSLGTNTITLSGADSGSFEVDGLALFLKSGVTLNFETKQSYAVTVSVGDASIPGSTPVTMGFTLSVTNTNETPTDITLPPTNIAENAGVNAVVGLLGTVDPDTGNTFTYTLVAGTGSTDNASFNISGNELRATASLDFEARRYYSVRVRSTDQGGLFTEEQFPITVTDIVEMQFVTVGNVGNSPDPATGSLYGAVNYQYGIGAYEVTIGQYTAFLNAVAQSDPYSLYSTSMASDLNIAGIARSGTAGSYTYSVMNNGGDSSDRPITYVSWFDAARFANWMHNGQPRGAQGPSTTERGAYTLDGQTSGAGPARNSGAAFHIPTENEWYKAAYYSPVKGGPGSPGYSTYATQSDTAPGNTIGNGANQANYYAGAYSVTQAPTLAPVPSQNYLTNVGAFTNSASYYGTFDQDGNVWEVSEVIASDSSCTRRGGSWNFLVAQLSSFSRETSFLSDEYPDDGFRLARPVADPSNVAPTDVTLSATSIAENAGSNALVGTFTTTDPDADNTFTYALVSGTGSTDNAAFNISGNQLRASASLDFETRNSYSIRVRAFDQGGLFTEHTFTITVTNIPVEMQFRTVGNAGSGGVAYEYRIGTYEVTNAEYATFLSAVAGTDAHGLYSEAMNGSPVGGITRTGSAGSYAYAVKSNMGDKPVTFVNWFDVARFANWMHNGQPSGSQGPATTERGAYTLDGQTSGSPPPRSPEARFAIPNQAEWRKAAYYAPTINSGAGGFYAYATQSDSEPAAVTADAGGGGSAGNAGHFANYGRSADWNGQDGNVTTVGSNGGSSFYGTFDQNGNVSELTEETSPQSGVPHATILGGNWLYDVSWLSTELAQAIQTTGQNIVGFRLARPA